ncbi:MAG: GPP34 family phosphoprotein [Anaerolineae bacterium]|nr:GPP34 family phosphoprotein [Anaerolineae bacterium]
MFNLSEELFLLAINDAKGTLMGSASGYLRYGLAGAALSDLALREKLTIDEKKRIVLREGRLTGDALLDETIEHLQASTRTRKASGWINRLGTGKLVNCVADRLIEQGVLTREKRRFLWVISYATYPQQDAAGRRSTVKYEVKQRLRAAILGGETPDARTLALLSLVSATRMLPLVFTPDERKVATRQIGGLVKEDVFGQAVAEVLQAIDAATVVAVTAAASS